MDRMLVQVVAVSDSDPEELADLASQLNAELTVLDVPRIEPLSAEEAPEGAKGIGQLAGWLVVQFGTLDGLRVVVAAVRSWAGRTTHTVEISVDGDVLKVSAATSQQQQEIINAWLARHGADA